MELIISIPKPKRRLFSFFFRCPRHIIFTRSRQRRPSVRCCCCCCCATIIIKPEHVVLVGERCIGCSSPFRVHSTQPRRLNCSKERKLFFDDPVMINVPLKDLKAEIPILVNAGSPPRNFPLMINVPLKDLKV